MGLNVYKPDCCKALSFMYRPPDLPVPGVVCNNSTTKLSLNLYESVKRFFLVSSGPSHSLLYEKLIHFIRDLAGRQSPLTNL